VEESQPEADLDRRCFTQQNERSADAIRINLRLRNAAVRNRPLYGPSSHERDAIVLLTAGLHRIRDRKSTAIENRAETGSSYKAVGEEKWCATQSGPHRSPPWKQRLTAENRAQTLICARIRRAVARLRPDFP